MVSGQLLGFPQVEVQRQQHPACLLQAPQCVVTHLVYAQLYLKEVQLPRPAGPAVVSPEGMHANLVQPHTFAAGRTLHTS